jgi:hypothetical protein
MSAGMNNIQKLESPNKQLALQFAAADGSYPTTQKKDTRRTCDMIWLLVVWLFIESIVGAPVSLSIFSLKRGHKTLGFKWGSASGSFQLTLSRPLLFTHNIYQIRLYTTYYYYLKSTNFAG